MSFKFVRYAKLLLFVVFTMGSLVARAGSDKLGVELFFENPTISRVALSPDGKTVGVLVTAKNGRVQLATIELATKTAKVVSGFSNADISEFHWVNNERLVFSTADNSLAIGETRYYPGLFAVNKDGSDSRTLVDRIWVPDSTASTMIKSRILSGENYFLQVDTSPNSESVFVIEPVWNNMGDLRTRKLIRVNTKTGVAEKFSQPGDTKHWMIDEDGVPRINVTTEDGIEKTFYKDRKDGNWRLIQTSKIYNGVGFTPYELGGDGNLYVLSRKGRDTSALFRFDLEKNTVDAQPIVAIDGYDFEGSLIFDRENKQLLGVSYKNDAVATVWLDDKMKAVQKAVDALLPNTINQIDLPRDGIRQYVVIRSYSDVQPVFYTTYDLKSGKLDLLGAAFSKIDPKKMAMQDMVRYKARDGLMIPAYLTLPRGAEKKNLPMVVLVHGGPYVRGASWGWNPQVQFLASRGYVVLQPEFRGSTGFGFKHFRAGWKQWGRAMQDDIADGAKWAIEQGIADPKRICIAGASYGGYSTLMGLANNPELFKCGVEWAGVTDLRFLYQYSVQSDLSAEYQQYGLPVLVGDRVQDAELLRANSPTELTEKITQPLLMAYGGADRRVPIEHGEVFYKKIKQTNDKVIWIRYDDEGHGWSVPKNRFDFWNRVDQFLQDNIGTK